MKIKIDKFTEQQAIDFADREAKLNGFSKKSKEWEKAYKKSLSESLETMTLGRNPRDSKKSVFEVEVKNKAGKRVALIEPTVFVNMVKDQLGRAKSAPLFLQDCIKIFNEKNENGFIADQILKTKKVGLTRK